MLKMETDILVVSIGFVLTSPTNVILDTENATPELLLEDRKFKSTDSAGSLLGAEQEEWLQDWCDNDQGMHLKVVLTQTPFGSLVTHRRGSDGLVAIPTRVTEKAGRTRAVSFIVILLSSCQRFSLQD
jgi:hypothetical protein